MKNLGLAKMVENHEILDCLRENRVVPNFGGPGRERKEKERESLILRKEAAAAMLLSMHELQGKRQRQRVLDIDKNGG